MKKGNKVQIGRELHMFLEKFQDSTIETASLVAQGAQTNTPALLAELVISQDHITTAWWK